MKNLRVIVLAMLLCVFVSTSIAITPVQATLSTTVNTKSYEGDGSTAEFSFPYLFYDEDHLVVMVDGITKTITTDYTVSGEGDEAGGSVTFLSPPADESEIIIQRVVPYDQQTDLENFDGNPADVTEKQFDLLAMQSQQLAEQQDRTILVPIGTTLASNDISGTITSSAKLIGVSTSGPEVTGYTTTQLDALAAAIEALSDGSGVLVSSNDTTIGYLNGKLVAGTGITFTEGSDGGNETLTVAISSDGVDTDQLADTAVTAAKADIASQAEAEAGTNTTKIMNPLRTAQAIAALSGIAQNYISGLILSLDTDTDHDINITAGQATDSANTEYLTLSTEITKQIDATFAAGDDAGGMFTGSVANSTTYYVWLIEKDDDGTIDAGFDTSSSGANVPTGYSIVRSLGAVRTDGSANISYIAHYRKNIEYVETPEQSVSSIGLITLSHMLSGTPTDSEIILVCKTTDAGYAVDDEIVMPPVSFDSAGNAAGALVLSVDDADIYITVAGTFRIANKSSGAFATLTKANWRAVARATYRTGD